MGSRKDKIVSDKAALDVDWMKAIGKAIRDFREGEKLSMADIAAELDVVHNYYGQIERGEKTPSLPMFLMILRTLEADSNTILHSVLNYKGDGNIVQLSPTSRYSELTIAEKEFAASIIDSIIEAMIKNRK